ncbi:MAG TPA: archaeal heat shock protein Hsp20 [Ktedonobacteraceae bacterium]|jgi:HSP20 family protein|nr:archaeal heat shock protein Hsp20 [Ktedonobacteraceae bacterium]
MPEKADDQKKKADPSKVEIDLGIGKFSFSDMFQGLGSLIDLANRLEKEGLSETRQEREITSPSGEVKAVYGVSVRRGAGGRPTVEPFGNVRKTAQGSIVEEERQPLVDIFDETDHILIIVELPGVEEEQIHTEAKDGTLTLSAAGRERKYSKVVDLPADVDTGTLTSKYKNGVLEIRISKKQHG